MKTRYIVIFVAIGCIFFGVLLESDMSQTNENVLSQGNWGGTDVLMSVGASKAELQFACADGEIAGQILLSKDNTFKVDGIYSRRGPGPTREGDHGRPAQYIGHLSGDRLTLKVVLKSDDSVIGEFVLEKGKSVRIRRCY
jgi:hypothetical protein